MSSAPTGASAVAGMVDRLRHEYRAAQLRHQPLTADPILYDEAHALYDGLAKGNPDEARLWAAIWVYELQISPHQMHYLRWRELDGTGEVAIELLGDFETRRVETDLEGNPKR